MSSSPTTITTKSDNSGQPSQEDTFDSLPSFVPLLCSHYQGQWLRDDIVPGVISAQQHFVARPSDIILCSFPKSGSTWLKAMMFCLATHRDYPQLADHPLLSTNPHSCVRFLEEIYNIEQGTRALELVERSASPRLFASHMAYSLLPESIKRSPGCRIVYVCRELKDTLVSYWKFLMGITEKTIGLEEFIEPYLNEKGYWGPIWDHILDYWKVSLENPNNVMFLKYEDIKRDERGTLRRLANFMGNPFSQEDEEGGVVEKIIELCNFETLSKLEVNKSGTMKSLSFKVFSNRLYFRRGEAGDWVNHMSSEMAKRIDDITAMKFRGSGLTFGNESPK